MAEWKDYMMEGTEVLKNKFGIVSEEELKEVETEIVVEKLSYLYINGMPGNFDAKHLCAINRFLFEDIYDFAGKYREVDMFKVTGFEKNENIKGLLANLFDNFNNRNVKNDPFSIGLYLGDYYYALIKIHPFREGNGRTCREFIRQLVLAKFPQYQLDYTKIDKENFLLGAIYHDQYPSLLGYELSKALVPRINLQKSR